jgi:hypothetical protein
MQLTCMIKYALRVKTEPDTARFLQNNVYLARDRTRPEFQALRWRKFLSCHAIGISWRMGK